MPASGSRTSLTGEPRGARPAHMPGCTCVQSSAPWEEAFLRTCPIPVAILRYHALSRDLRRNSATTARACAPSPMSTRVFMPQTLNSWEDCVRAYLKRSGGSALRSELGSVVKLPPDVNLRYTAALRECGFQVTGETVLCEGYGCRDVTLSDLMGKRPRARRPREDDDDDERPARRKQRTEPLGWSIDPRPAREEATSAEEEAARYERGFRFGTPSSGAGPRDGAPSRPPAAFRWARYDCSWQALAPRSAGQQHYVNLLRDESVSVVVGLGKAGTGP